MPIDDRSRVSAALNAMRSDPFGGDLTALKGPYRGSSDAVPDRGASFSGSTGTGV